MAAQKNTVNVLSETYLRRIQAVALGHEQTVELSVRHGSGKTLELLVVVPGIKALTHYVVRLHRKLHKEFYRIVAAAKAWLANYKALFAPVAQQAQVLLLPATVPERSSSQMLAVARSNIPFKDTLYGYEKKQAYRNEALARFGGSDTVYSRSLTQTAIEAGLL